MDQRRLRSRIVLIKSAIIPDHSRPSSSTDGERRLEKRSHDMLTSDNESSDGGTPSNCSAERSVATKRCDPPCASFLKDWRTLDPADIINLLKESRGLLEELLNYEIQDKEMDLLVGAIGKACNYYTGSERIREILNLLQRKEFLEVYVTPWIARWISGAHASDTHKVNFGSTVFLLKGFMKEVPESIGSIRVIASMLKRIVQKYDENNIHLSPEVSLAVKDVLDNNLNHPQSSWASVPSTTGVRKVPHRDVPDDFRSISILPTSKELHSDFKPFLRSNIVNGCYDNVHHYLDVHFRLLREDFVQPLREGIAEYTIALKREGNIDAKIFQSLSIYHNVRAIDVTPSQGGMVYVLQFDVGRRVRWEFSKKLIYGSLVCLSRDDFQTLIFGVVSNSDPWELRVGKVEVTLEISEDISQDLFSFSFKMAESSSYFEAYRHVLRSLQTIHEENFPFKQYLISISSDVNLPKYIRENLEVKFSLRSCRRDQGNEQLEDPWTRFLSCHFNRVNMKEVKVSEENDWPSADELGFDDSQMKAYKAALREEVCLIQGPPGTGKTYVGLKIVETLLQNKERCHVSGPLLVVCYTNHALDQFLEGILETTAARVVRIGGRSSSETLKKLNINQVARDQSLGSKYLRREFSIAKSGLESCRSKIQQCKYLIDVAGKKILKYRTLLHTISLSHCKSLSFHKTKFRENDILAGWLGIVDETGRITLSTESSRSVCSEKLSNLKWRRVENERSQTSQETQQGVLNEGLFYTDHADWLERRYLDDEDDFFRAIKLTDNPRPNVTVEIREHFVNENGKRVRQICSVEKIDKIIETKLSRTGFMTEEEVDNICNVWELDIQQRWRLYKFWVQSFIERRKEKLRDEHRNLAQRTKELKELIFRERLNALRGISVIGVTTTGAAKNDELLREIAPPIVIIEEAAEILEAHVITSLSAKCQHLILIGDHQQLRPNPTVYKLCKDYKLDVSLFERLIRNGMPCHRLSLQHRMRPEISHILTIHKDFYPGLLDHEMVKNYHHIRGIDKDVYFIEHNCPEQHNDENKSKSNLHEALFMISLCKYLLQQGYTSKQITILTAYQGQVRNFMDWNRRENLGGVRVCPIDNFQGEENDIILISFVRSNQEGNIGFLKVSNRVCVALSRAKQGLYCIGNFTLMAEKSDLWKAVISDLKNRELIGPKLKLMCRNHPERFTEVSSAEDFKDVPDGGCDEPCNARLNCGHTCQKKCHPEDKEHQNVLCMKPCERKCEARGHNCRRLCHEPCMVECREEVKMKLPCSHEMLIECYLQPEQARCRSNCERILTCGHQCQRRCFEECRADSCKVMIKRTFEPCGHEATVQCSEESCPKTCRILLKCGHPCRGTCGKCRNGRFHEKCERRCTRILVCGHECKSKCSSTCPPCRQPCENRCQHNKCVLRCGKSCTSCTEPCLCECRHLRCKAKCGDDCDRKHCDEPCEVQLKCGHLCIGLCGEPCPPFCRVCDKDTVTRILFGNEDEPDARFIFLAECNHIVEVGAMDHLMTMRSSSDQQIKLPECPWCKTPIRFNPRYNNTIKAVRRDVEQVKRQIRGFGCDERFNEKLEMMKLRIANMKECGSSFYFPISFTTTADENQDAKNMNLVIRKARFRMCRNIEEDIDRQKLLTSHDLSKIEIQLDMFKKLDDLYHQLRMSDLDHTNYQNSEIDEQLKHFQEDYLFLLNKTKSFMFITEQEIEDWQREYQRCRHRITFARVLKVFTQPGVKLEDIKKEKEMLDEAGKLLSDGAKFSEDKDSKVGETLKELKTRNPLLASIGITEEERDMVVKAMGLTRGHWFKCSNGHVYAIGECGGAMERSQCPECKTSIGGERHKLDEGNTVATEMDGALHPAYSEEANNMLNFEELI